MYRKNVASQHIGFQLVSATDGSAITGTATVKIVIDGGSQGTASGTATHKGGGQYDFALAQADTNGNNISLQFTATGAVAVEKTFVTTAADPTDGVRLGLTSLPNAAAGAAGGLRTTITLLKNTALSAFTFVMLDTSGVPKTGATVTAQRSLDGAALGSCANSVSEISNGIYKIDLAASDTNANTIMFRFSASGAADSFYQATTNS